MNNSNQKNIRPLLIKIISENPIVSLSFVQQLTGKKIKSMLLCMMLTMAMAITAVGCGSKTENTAAASVEDIIATLDGVHDRPVLIFARTSLDAASHLCAPLSNGVDHFGGFGSYTVMIIAVSSDVVQTTCTYRPRDVLPQSKQHGPRLCSG